MVYLTAENYLFIQKKTLKIANRVAGAWVRVIFLTIPEMLC